MFGSPPYQRYTPRGRFAAELARLRGIDSANCKLCGENWLARSGGKSILALSN